MIVILVGAAGSGIAALGPALAAALGWRWEDVRLPRNELDRDRHVAAVHARIAAAAGRREPLVITCPPLERRHYDVLRGDLPRIRFVHVEDGGRHDPERADLTLVARQPQTAMLAQIRTEFGL